MIGLLGGTFDPVHEGHLLLARQVLDRYALQRLYLVPARQNPLKAAHAAASAPDRLEMLRLALAETHDDRLSVLDWEVRSTQPSYTIRTVERLLAASASPLALVMGNDVFAGLARWHEARKLVRLVDFIVVERDPKYAFHPDEVLRATGVDDPRTESENRVRYAGGVHWVDRFAMKPLPFSATQLRQQLTDGPAGRTPQGIQRSVWQYIKEKRLYTVTKREG